MEDPRLTHSLTHSFPHVFILQSFAHYLPEARTQSQSRGERGWQEPQALSSIPAPRCLHTCVLPNLERGGAVKRVDVLS